MALSMVIAESLVARTFGTYTIRAFGGDPDSFLVPVIGVALIVVAYLVNVSGSRSVGLLSIIMAVIKVGGIALFGVAGLWASGLIDICARKFARGGGMLTAIALDAVVLTAFAAMK